MTSLAATVRIKDVRQDDDGVWRATLVDGNRTIGVDRLYGSWRITPSTDDDDNGRGYTLLHPALAAEIQRTVYPVERRAARLRNELSTTTTKEHDMADATAPTTTPVKQKDAAKKTQGKGKPAKAKAAAKPAKAKGPSASDVNYKAAVAATPKGKDKAVNANAIAKKLTEKRGKTVWPMPTKSHLEKAVTNGDVKREIDGSKVTYYRA